MERIENELKVTPRDPHEENKELDFLKIPS